MTAKKCLRAVAIILGILAIIWLVENWSVMPELLDIGFTIPLKEFAIFGLGFITCHVISKLNSESKAVQVARAEGSAQIEAAKADMVEQKKRSTPVDKARARSKADIANARAKAKAEAMSEA